MTDAEKKQIIAKLMEIAKNEIRLTYSMPDEKLSLCSSRIGGCPAVPAGFVWPEYTGEGYDGEVKCRPLSFMAQINLKDVTEYDTEGILPKTGILSFFYEQISMSWGFDPKDKGSARVYYFPDETELTLRDIPESMDEECIIPELAVTFESHISLPEFSESPEICHDLDWDDYDECRQECGYENDEWGDRTKLLGYPDTIQNPMEEECETVTRGFRQGSPEDAEKVTAEEKEDIRCKAKEWIPLFQMGTIETDDREFMFGDCGHLYFWIRKSELQQCNFDNVWLILQCC